jgi:hypothetical protein
MILFLSAELQLWYALFFALSERVLKLNLICNQDRTHVFELKNSSIKQLNV